MTKILAAISLTQDHKWSIHQASLLTQALGRLFSVYRIHTLRMITFMSFGHTFALGVFTIRINNLILTNQYESHS